MLLHWWDIKTPLMIINLHLPPRFRIGSRRLRQPGTGNVFTRIQVWLAMDNSVILYLPL